MRTLQRPTSLGPTFDRLWSASATSNFADGIIGTAAPLLAVSLTRDPFIIAMFGAVTSVSWLLFAVPIGAVADRVDRGVALTVVNLVRFALFVVAVAAIVMSWMSLPLLFVLAFLVGVCEVFVDTTTQAVLPMVLEQEQFESGNARMSLTESVIQTFVGAPLGSFLFAMAIALPFALGVVGYFIAALFIFAMVKSGDHPLKADRRAERPHFFEDLKSGLRFLAGHPQLRFIVGFTSFLYVLFGIAHATLTLFVLDTLGVPHAWFGAAMSIGGLGYIAGASLATRVSARFGRGRAMATCMLICAVCTVAESFSPNIWVLSLIGALSSGAISVWNIMLMSSYQVLIPAEMFGRVHGARRTFVWGFGPVGAAVGGWLAGFGLRVPIFVGGVAIVIATLLGFRRIVRLGDSTV